MKQKLKSILNTIKFVIMLLLGLGLIGLSIYLGFYYYDTVKTLYRDISIDFSLETLLKFGAFYWIVFLGLLLLIVALFCGAIVLEHAKCVAYGHAWAEWERKTNHYTGVICFIEDRICRHCKSIETKTHTHEWDDTESRGTCTICGRIKQQPVSLYAYNYLGNYLGNDNSGNNSSDNDNSGAEGHYGNQF